MRSEPELEAMAKRIIDGNRYMTIATADDNGLPWVTPVYFNPDGYQDLYLISSLDAQHSRNLAVRSDVSIVVFDSQVGIGHAEAVYMRAHAQELAEPTLEDCAVAFRPAIRGSEGLRPGRPPCSGKAPPVSGHRDRALGFDQRERSRMGTRDRLPPRRHTDTEF